MVGLSCGQIGHVKVLNVEEWSCHRLYLIKGQSRGLRHFRPVNNMDFQCGVIASSVTLQDDDNLKIDWPCLSMVRRPDHWNTGGCSTHGADPEYAIKESNEDHQVRPQIDLRASIALACTCLLPNIDVSHFLLHASWFSFTGPTSKCRHQPSAHAHAHRGWVTKVWRLTNATLVGS